MGTKRSVLTEGHGLPIAVVVSGANVHDVKLLAKTLDNLVIFRPLPTEASPQNLCLDAGYTGHEEDVTERNYIPHIRPRGEEKLELERNPEFKARRWVVEVTHSFVNRFRKLLVRFEKSDNSYLGLLELAFSIIVWRNIIPVHQGMIIVG
jgi:putative transposase